MPRGGLLLLRTSDDSRIGGADAQPGSASRSGRLRPRLFAHDGEQAGDVVLAGLLGEVEPLADGPVGESLTDQVRNHCGGSPSAHIPGDGVQECLVVRDRAEQQTVDVPVPRTDLPAHLHAAPVRQPHVSRTSTIATSGAVAGSDQGVFRGSGLADHLDVGVCGEQCTDAAPDHFMIVEEE